MGFQKTLRLEGKTTYGWMRLLKGEMFASAFREIAYGLIF